jgi:hypothetical protein
MDNNLIFTISIEVAVVCVASFLANALSFAYLTSGKMDMQNHRIHNIEKRLDDLHKDRLQFKNDISNEIQRLAHKHEQVLSTLLGVIQSLTKNNDAPKNDA